MAQSTKKTIHGRFEDLILRSAEQKLQLTQMKYSFHKD